MSTTTYGATENKQAAHGGSKSKRKQKQSGSNNDGNSATCVAMGIIFGAALILLAVLNVPRLLGLWSGSISRGIELPGAREQ